MKNILITGCSRGIGLELTKQSLEKGHTVYGLCRSPEKMAELKAKFPQTLKLHKVDVTHKSQLEAAAKEMGLIDLLINNAGVFNTEEDGGGFESLSAKAVLQTMEVNTFAPLTVVQVFLNQLKKGENPTLINITSLMGSIQDNTSGGYYAYRMSKAALNMFTKSFSVDFPEITSVVIHPGWVRTDMGGEQAPTEPAESAQGILRVIENLKKQDSGKFFDFEGDPLPW